MSQLNIKNEFHKIFRFAKSSMRDILRNRIRSVLSLLGIIIGVSSVIIIIGLNQSATVVVKNKVYTFGKNAARFHTRGLSWISRQDINNIKSIIPQIEYISPLIDDYWAVSYKNNKIEDVIVHSVENDYLFLKNWKIESGRTFNDEEIINSKRVVIIGYYIKEKLFPGSGDIFNKKIKINGEIFNIIGTLKAKGSGLSGTEYDKIVLLPSTSTARIFHNKTDKYEQLYLSVSDQIYENIMVEKLEQYFRKKYHVLPLENPSFTIDTTREKTIIIRYISIALKYLMIIVAGISLIVGGIGIMNIMLAVVNERIREIGIRMAIGAKKYDILLQFLMESLILCTVGGIIGILFGILFYKIITVVAAWPFILSIWPIMISLLFSFSVGLFFGLYPSLKASKLYPIDALKAN